MNGATETSINSEFEKDVSFDYDHFELELNKIEGEDYFDCVLNSDYRPMLVGQLETKLAGEQEALEGILSKASADIPFVIELDDVTVSGKLNSMYLREEYATLEDYSEQDVYILCKIVGLVRKDIVEIFDPLKDFIRLPRSMRRQMAVNGSSVGIDKNSVEGPVLKVEVIAIYK